MSDFNNVAFSDEQIFVLLQGLNALEGALKAIEQPLPNQLHELKGKLRAELDSFSDNESTTLTTEKVARILRISGKRVHQLASKGSLKIAQCGRKGRGYSTLYFMDSVKEYAMMKSGRSKQR